MILFRRIDRRLPAALITTLCISFLVFLCGWQARGVRMVADLNLPADPLLAFHLPQVASADILNLLPAAFSVALFSLVEAISIARALSQSEGDKFDASREFIGQGLASIAGGFFQSIPTTGSPSRSAVNHTAGAKTRLAAAFSGGFVLILLLIFSRWIGYIPIPGLTAVIIVSAAGLIDTRQIRLTWNTRIISRLVMAVTFFSVLLLPLYLAIYAGVLLTILIHLYESSRLHLNSLVFTGSGQVLEKPLADLLNLHPPVGVINVEGDLFFGAVHQLENAIESCCRAGIKVLVLRLRRAHMLASTGVVALQGILATARKAGMVIMLSGVSPQVRSILESSQITHLIGEEHIFFGSESLFESTRRAVAAATKLLE
jgi:SulP family sulfate permease